MDFIRWTASVKLKDSSPLTVEVIGHMAWFNFSDGVIRWASLSMNAGIFSNSGFSNFQRSFTLATKVVFLKSLG